MMPTWLTLLALLSIHQTTACVTKLLGIHLRNNMNNQLDLEDGATNTTHGWYVKMKNGELYDVDKLSISKLGHPDKQEFHFVVKFKRLACDYKYAYTQENKLPPPPETWNSMCMESSVFVTVRLNKKREVESVDVAFDVFKGLETNLNSDSLNKNVKKEMQSIIVENAKKVLREDLERSLKLVFSRRHPVFRILLCTYYVC